MISPVAATIFIAVFLVVFGVVLPILNRRIPEYISFRWSAVVVCLALLIGAVIDFNGLPDDARRILLIGGLIIVGGYVLLRTAEKCLARGWLSGARIRLKKGDAEAEIAGKDNK